MARVKHTATRKDRRKSVRPQPGLSLSVLKFVSVCVEDFDSCSVENPNNFPSLLICRRKLAGGVTCSATGTLFLSRTSFLVSNFEFRILLLFFFWFRVCLLQKCGKEECEDGNWGKLRSASSKVDRESKLENCSVDFGSFLF